MMKTQKRSRESRKSSSHKKEPMTAAQIKAMQKNFEEETGVYKSTRPSSLPKVKQAWGGKRHRKTAKRRRAKKSCGWFW